MSSNKDNFDIIGELKQSPNKSIRRTFLTLEDAKEFFANDIRFGSLREKKYGCWNVIQFKTYNFYKVVGELKQHPHKSIEKNFGLEKKVAKDYFDNHIRYGYIIRRNGKKFIDIDSKFKPEPEHKPKKKKKKKKFEPVVQVNYSEPINHNSNRRYTTRINQLKSSRHQFCGIGTRKVKLRLNKLMKENPLAAALRVALEAEDNSIKAKAAIRKYGRGHDFVDSIYKNKEEQINQLLEICEDNGFNYGVRSSGDSYPPYIVYVDLPNTQQISYHTDVDKQFRNRIYKGEWDGKQASTLPKIQKSILLNFPEIVKESDKKTKVQKIKKKKPQYNFPPIKHILLGEY